MIINDNQLDELFRSKLAEFEQFPPVSVWKGIRERRQAGKRRKMLQTVCSGTAAAVLLVVFLLGWQLRNEHDDLSRDAASTELGAVRDTFGTASSFCRSADLEGRSVENQEACRQEPVKKEDGPAYQPAEAGLVAAVNLREAGAKLVLHPLVRLDPLLNTDLQESELQFGEISGNKLSRAERLLVEWNMQHAGRPKTDLESRHWELAAVFSPVCTVNRTAYEETYASEMSRPGNKQHLEAGGGLQVEYHAGKRWSIHSGLLYSRLGQSSGSAGNNRTLASDQPAVSYFNNKVYLESPGRLSMNASAGVIEMNRLPDNAPVFSPMESGSGSSLLVAGDSFDQRFEYLEIPLLVGFRLTDRHWNVHFLGGFSANFLLGNQVYLNNGNGSTLVGKTRDMAVLNYAAILGMGMKYRLSRRICFQLEPRLKYYLESLSNNPDVSFKPYSVGIHTGISYRF